jgi:PAS domain S-box-containing protein
MAEGVVLQTVAGEITACNAAAERILGLTADQLMGRSSIDPQWRAIHEDGSSFPGETHPAMVTLATGRPVSGALMGVHKPDGSLTWISINSAPLTMPGAALPYAAVATFTDITEPRALADAHNRTRRQLQAIIDATTDAVYVKDPHGRYLLFNRAAEEFVGRAAGEVLGKDDTALFPADEAAAVMQADRTAMAQPTPSTWEESVTTAAGTIATFLTTKGPLLAADGSLLGLFGVARDITERKRAEEVISASRTELTEAQRIAHVGSWRWNAVTDIAYWSEEHYRIFGLNPSGPAPSAAMQVQLSDPETYERARAEAGRAIAESAPFEVEYDIVRADGQTRHVVVRGEPNRSDAGRVIEYRGSTADVTELHEAHKRLDQAQRAEMVGRLAGGVAHDFNNLLMAISGYAEFLAVGIPIDNPLRDDVDAIRRAGTRAAELTHQLLAFGRRQTLRPTGFAASDVVIGLLPMLTSLVGDTIRITPTDDGEAGLVLADRSELEHAIVNLVLNARDAMPSGGRIGIATATETLGAGSPYLRPPFAAGKYVRITVFDTGTGMDPATMDHIFEPFFTTKVLGQGTGLGLSSVDGAVAQSGGFVRVESVMGTGSSFSIFLPHSSARLAARLPLEARQASAEHRATILLVEDEPVVRAVTARLLRGLGHTVIEAALPAEALEAVHPTVDLLVTDVMMPGMNGRELAERLVRERPGLPVIYISGYSPESLFGDGLLDAGTPFLAKPFSREELAARVQEALEQRGARERRAATSAVDPPAV